MHAWWTSFGTADRFGALPSLIWSLEKFSSQVQVYEDLLMWVPLVVRGQTIGSIGLKLERLNRRYDLFDLALAEDLADRAAIALDNAKLYSKEQIGRAHVR